MYSPVADIALLLAASRELLSREDIDNIDVERLTAWGAERSAIFCRLKEYRELGSTEGFTDESLLRELLDVDAQIRCRIMECQTRIGKQMSAVRTMLQALPRASSTSTRLIERLV
jgi:hypothetical protein